MTSALPEENSAGAEMQIVLHHVVHGGRGEEADKRKQVRRGQHAAAMLLFRAMLDQRADGHDEEAAEESERRQKPQNGVELQPAACQQKTKYGDARWRRAESGHIRFCLPER